ncbi:MAG: ATP-binding protein [Microgenomates group bacterium]
MILREISKNIRDDFFKGKIIILTGARQVGKTTLVNTILDNTDDVCRLNADDPTDKRTLEKYNFEDLDALFADKTIIFIDEAQKVQNIGTTLKLLVDHYKSSKQIIATGSSTLNLLSNTSEALTGRKFVHELYGLSVREISPELDALVLEKNLPLLLVYGSYPEVFTSSVENKRRILIEITSSYLYQDILELENIRNPAVINKLLSAIALQLGSEVSLNELSSLTGLDVKTVERYIDLLEKNYVLFRLPPYYTNQRKTLSKLNKLYFYDLGVRNALINNYNQLELRADSGALWENFLMLERMKLRSYHALYANQYFWRTYGGAEVDLVEERSGSLFGYEFKWGGKKVSAPASWLEYPNSTFEVINQENYLQFLLKE